MEAPYLWMRLYLNYLRTFFVKYKVRKMEKIRFIRIKMVNENDVILKIVFIDI